MRAEERESDSGLDGLDGHGGPEKKTGTAAESGSESGGGLDGHGVPKKKKTGGARASESESESGGAPRAVQQRRCPGEYR